MLDHRSGRLGDRTAGLRERGCLLRHRSGRLGDRSGCPRDGLSCLLNDGGGLFSDLLDDWGCLLGYLPGRQRMRDRADGGRE
jgi:hypothetical protein